MSTQIFSSGVLLGFLLGVLVCYVSLQFLSRCRFHGKKREIGRLTEEFQELFRQMDKGNNQQS